jgi:RNA polymerase sigma-70 factor (ECF subfamily)
LPGCPPYNEKALLARIAANDEKAFRELFDLYKERFYAVALKMTRSGETAQDIVQDVFMQIWNNRENLAGVDNPPAYFFTAVYRKIYHHYRKLALEKRLLHVVAPAELSMKNVTEEMVLAHESEVLISQAIAKLPPQQKLVFKLSRQEGLSRDAIASQLHISAHTVKNHLLDAVKFIRSFLRNSAYIFLFIFWLLKK